MQFQIDAIYGHVVLRSWVENRIVDGKLIGIGMSMRQDVDKYGNITSVKIEETGLIMTMA